MAGKRCRLRDDWSRAARGAEVDRDSMFRLHTANSANPDAAVSLWKQMRDNVLYNDMKPRDASVAEAGFWSGCHSAEIIGHLPLACASDPAFMIIGQFKLHRTADFAVATT